MEESALVLLPIDDRAPIDTMKDGVKIRFWGDPDTSFVGKLDGMQSSDPTKFTGYGIYASGLLPVAKNMLASDKIEVDSGSFDELHILRSLGEGNPVMFWYVLNADTNRFSQVQWKTWSGKSVIGYIGEHTGVIVGAHFDKQGKIQTISYYEGRSDMVRTESFATLSRKAKWLNAALYPKG